MKRFLWMLVAACLVCVPLWAQDEADATKTDDAKATPEKTEADLCYDKIVGTWMLSQWVELKDALDAYPKQRAKMSKEQRADVEYVTRMAQECRPAWWKKARSSSSVSFRADIWGKPIMANYMPSGMLGLQAPVDIYRGRLRVIVSWQPSVVDSPMQAKGELAKLHHIRKGDIGEAIVWHELGHNYISSRLTAKQVIELYNEHYMVYEHLQEFYADMTALYHCGSRGRLTTLLMRTDGLDWYHESEAHTRASHGIGALVLTHMMMEPEKWPSAHFPPKVPQEEPERKTIIYLYDHLDAGWTLAEDRALREFVGELIAKQGDYIFRNKGKVPLPNDLAVHLMATEDREMQPKRNAWVSQRLAELIKNGRADKPVPGEKEEVKDDRRWSRSDRIELPW